METKFLMAFTYRELEEILNGTRTIAYRDIMERIKLRLNHFDNFGE